MARKTTNSPVRKFLDGGKIRTFADALRAAGERPSTDSDRETKRNYAQYLSEAIAVFLANSLRKQFVGILPKENGEGQESRARTGKGVKKLDVNYSTPELGLGLGLSIKTLNFRDPKTRRYTKNPTRLDNELRAEAMDYHERQPYSVLVGLVFVPNDACDDGDPAKHKTSRSSFAQIVDVLRHRAGRKSPRDDAQLFERIYVALYEHAGNRSGDVRYFDVNQVPPQFGTPATERLRDLKAMLTDVIELHDSRNKVKPAWSTDLPTAEFTIEELENQGLIPEEDDEPSEEEL